MQKDLLNFRIASAALHRLAFNLSHCCVEVICRLFEGMKEQHYSMDSPGCRGQKDEKNRKAHNPTMIGAGVHHRCILLALIGLGLVASALAARDVPERLYEPTDVSIQHLVPSGPNPDPGPSGPYPRPPPPFRDLKITRPKDVSIQHLVPIGPNPDPGTPPACSFVKTHCVLTRAEVAVTP
ncbi:hypothetical protein EJB05_07800, partial [Eragrostis curvula]